MSATNIANRELFTLVRDTHARTWQPHLARNLISSSWTLFPQLATPLRLPSLRNLLTATFRAPVHPDLGLSPVLACAPSSAIRRARDSQPRPYFRFPSKSGPRRPLRNIYPRALFKGQFLFFILILSNYLSFIYIRFHQIQPPKSKTTQSTSPSAFHFIFFFFFFNHCHNGKPLILSYFLQKLFLNIIIPFPSPLLTIAIKKKSNKYSNTLQK
jgi:hypothetical protein